MANTQVQRLALFMTGAISEDFSRILMEVAEEDKEDTLITVKDLCDELDKNFGCYD